MSKLTEANKQNRSSYKNIHNEITQPANKQVEKQNQQKQTNKPETNKTYTDRSMKPTKNRSRNKTIKKLRQTNKTRSRNNTHTKRK
jgi:hypothetical protein